MSTSSSHWLQRARLPKKAVPTASAFADWVFQESRNYSVQKNEGKLEGTYRSLRLQLGTVTHRHIELFLMFKWTQEFLESRDPSDWVLVFADNKHHPERIFEATTLRIGEQPLRCVPDVVLKNVRQNIYLVIERKTTFVPEPNIPIEGWPNVEAQLWCYSWIDDWKNAEEVLLVGQLWHRIGGGISLCHRHPAWKRSDPAHHGRCLAWFKKYGGIFRRDKT